MEVTWIIAIIIGAASAVALIVSLIRKSSAKNKERLERVAIELGANIEFGDWKSQPVISGEMESTEYQITFHVVNSGNASITYLDLKVPCQSVENKIVVKKYGSVAKFFGKLGIGNRIESGDPTFDSQVVLKGKSNTRLTSLAYDSNFKNAALVLAKRNYVTEIKAPTAIASKVYKTKIDLDATVLANDLRALIELVGLINK